jgi:hypothetical protein
MAASAEPKPSQGRTPLVSPLAFARSGALLVVALAALHATGARESASVLSGTAPSSGSALLGGAYAAAYFAAVLGAPVLVVAAALFAVLGRVAYRGGVVPRANAASSSFHPPPSAL